MSSSIAEIICISGWSIWKPTPTLIRVGVREIPEIPQFFGGFKNECVVPVYGFVDLDDLPVGRTKLGIADVGIEVAVAELAFVLEDRQGSRGVDDDLGVVGDRLARSFAGDARDRAVVVLDDVLDDRVVVNRRAEALGFFEDDLAVAFAVQHGPRAAEADLDVVVAGGVLEDCPSDRLVGERLVF